MNREDTPFIHCIETPIGQYVFDVNQNQFLSISDEGLYRALQALEENGEEPAPEYETEISKLQTRGFLSSRRPQEMRHGMTDMLEYQLNHNIEQMTLQLTQACNFRCSYCTYAPRDFSYQREHTSKRMSWDTAQQAIDFYAAHSYECMEPTIGFYGGEPLLAFDLIQQIVEYAQQKFEGKGLRFTITTNGSLLVPRTAQYLQDKQISVMVSLDGDRTSHNRSRKIAKTGEGSFDLIMKNLRVLKDTMPDFFSKIRYNVVMDSRFSGEEVTSFFSENELFADSQVTPVSIEDGLSMERTVTSDVFYAQRQKQILHSLLLLLNKVSPDALPKLSRSALDRGLQYIRENMTKAEMSPVVSHSGPCLPGQRRLFVDVDGKFFPCERVSETSAAMLIGDIHSGFDYEQAKKLLNVCQLTENACRNCWALAHCKACCRMCDNMGELSGGLKLTNCREFQSSVESDFRLYLLLKEHHIQI